MGVGVLIGGIILFGYGSLMISGLFDKLPELYPDLVEVAVNTGMGLSPFQIVEQQLLLMQLLQLIGLVMAVLGSVMLAYGLWLKKEENK